MGIKFSTLSPKDQELVLLQVAIDKTILERNPAPFNLNDRAAELKRQEEIAGNAQKMEELRSLGSDALQRQLRSDVREATDPLHIGRMKSFLGR